MEKVLLLLHWETLGDVNWQFSNMFSVNLQTHSSHSITWEHRETEMGIDWKMPIFSGHFAAVFLSCSTSPRPSKCWQAILEVSDVSA